VSDTKIGVRARFPAGNRGQALCSCGKSGSDPDFFGRREVLKAAMAGFIGATCPGIASRAFAADIDVVKINERFALVVGAGGNVLVRHGDNGQVLVDTGSAEHAASLRDALASLAGAGRVELAFNTHWHPEQTGSNGALGQAGATLVAHAKTRQRLAIGYYVPHEDRFEPAVPADAVPTETFHDRGERLVDGERIEYGYLLEAHTDGDIYVYFRDSNVIAVGDALSPARDPEIDWFGGGWLGGRVDALALLLELVDDETIVVPSYGPVVRKADIAAEHGLMQTLFERTTTLLRQGYSADDMLAAGVLADLPRTFADPLKFLYDVHKSLWAHHNTISHDIV